MRELQIEPYTIQMDYKFVMEGLGIRKTLQQVQQAGWITAEDASRWMSDQQRAEEAGLFYSAITFFMVAGQKR